MGLPLVGKGRRKAHSTQARRWNSGAISYRIRGPRCSRCSSAHHQYAVGPQPFMRNDSPYALGALFSRRTAPEGNLNPRHILDRGDELDSSAIGESFTRRSQNGRGRTLVTSGRLGGWNQGQNQVHHVGSVFARRPLEILPTQPNLVGGSCRHGRKPRSKHGRPCQCQTPESSPGSVPRGSQARPRGITFPGPASGFLDWGIGNSKRRSGCLALDGPGRYQKPCRLRKFSLL